MTTSDDKNTPDSDDVDETVEENGAAQDAVETPSGDAEPAADDASDTEVIDDTGESADEDEPERLYTKADVDKLLAESSDRMLRVMAEYDNFRRRTAREKEQWIVDALEDFVKDLLPVFDAFDKARENGAGDDASALAMKEGLDVTHKQLQSVLDKYRIEVIDPVGEAFDPTFHEALMRQPSPDHAPGTVVTVFERGYKLGSRLIRPARTVVAADD
jgi:molecular chaperone GrpE